VGSFTWRGTYNTAALTCTLTKAYATHDVAYQGQVDENGIWGTWSLFISTGGFHLWPIDQEEEEEEAALEQEEVAGTTL